MQRRAYRWRGRLTKVGDRAIKGRRVHQPLLTGNRPSGGALWSELRRQRRDLGFQIIFTSIYLIFYENFQLLYFSIVYLLMDSFF